MDDEINLFYKKIGTKKGSVPHNTIKYSPGRNVIAGDGLSLHSVCDNLNSRD